MTSRRDRANTPWLEWAVGAVGAILFGGILFVLLSSALLGGDAPPAIRTRVESIEPTGQTWVVQFVAVNEGDVTAAQVQLDATFQAADGSTERSEVTLDFLPPYSERRGGFVFARDPRGRHIEIAAHGYVDP